MSDRIFAGIWLLLCIAGLFIAWQMMRRAINAPISVR